MSGSRALYKGTEEDLDEKGTALLSDCESAQEELYINTFLHENDGNVTLRAGRPSMDELLEEISKTLADKPECSPQDTLQCEHASSAMPTCVQSMRTSMVGRILGTRVHAVVSGPLELSQSVSKACHSRGFSVSTATFTL